MSHDRRGSAGETLFFILIAAMLFFGAVEIGRAFAIKDALDTGVSVAVRQLSLNPSAWDQAEATVRDEVDGNFLGGGYGARLTLTLMDGNGTVISPGQLAAMKFSAEFRLRASLPLHLAIPFLGRSDKTIQVEHRMLIERYP